ncbi:hypothetical protein CEP49_00830 [Mergibacter septicus]|uniref:YwiC-like family protein n=1 Tax=Mergibacter septicus TaxID=221402 RepID=UPI001179245A|nr:YwiC-like family protein [Mergibacter septicus]AWX13189.1 hypothetical protein CEP49_00830 [Mergibacter septicus]
MKLLVSNQHGAVVMALMPFLYGSFLASSGTYLGDHFVWQQIALFFAWISAYLMSYPLLALFKAKKVEVYRKWVSIYATTAVIFALPALFYNPTILYFVLLFLPLVAINIYYSKIKNERALGNDLTAIFIFSLIGVLAYYFPQQRLDLGSLKVGIEPSLFFIGSTLYVKSVLRERKNPRYYQASVFFHLLCCGLSLYWDNTSLALAFIFPCLRAILLPKYKLSVKQTGIGEFITTFFFFLPLFFDPILT